MSLDRPMVPRHKQTPAGPCWLETCGGCHQPWADLWRPSSQGGKGGLKRSFVHHDLANFSVAIRLFNLQQVD